MLYLLPIFIAFAHYTKWRFGKLQKLQKNVRDARKKYTLEDEMDFIVISKVTDGNSTLGLHKNQPEYKALAKKREEYFRVLSELREFQRSMFLWEDIGMEEEEIDDHGTWNIKMSYRLGINKKNFFQYYSEYVKDIFGFR